MKTIGSSVLMLCLMITTAAQTIWPTKPYTDWSLDEVTRILSDSPWTQTNARGIELLVQLRLYSALPVRQAIVRRMQLTIPYDKLAPGQRAAFDTEVEGLLQCPHCGGYYIVTLSSSASDRSNLISRGGAVTLDMVTLLKRLPEDDVLRHVSLLNDKGERRNATHVVFTPKNEVVLLFPRFDDRGKALIAVNDKKFYVDFDEYIVKKAEGTLKKFTFVVSDLVRDGKVVF